MLKKYLKVQIMMRLTCKYLIFSVCFTVVVILSGCVNPYYTHYEDMLRKWPYARSFLQETPDEQSPKLVTSKDMRGDAFFMLEDGYILIGKSTFRSPPINEKKALIHAEKVGADVVLIKQEYVNTVTQSVPITEWMPDRTISTVETTTFKKNPSAPPQVFRREITQTLEGEAYIRYVPRSTEYYNHSATFWKKSKPSICGVLVHALDEDTKKRLQSNKGVIVKVVVNRSPAFFADILRGDIITTFNNKPVADPKDFFDKIRMPGGEYITLKIIRNDIPRDISFQLNPR